MKQNTCIFVIILSFVAGAILSSLGFLLFFISRRKASCCTYTDCCHAPQYDLDYEVEHCEDPDAWYGGYEDIEKD